MAAPPVGAFHAMTLVAAVRAAYGASRQIADRRAGRDPSAQEPEREVRSDLATLGADLRGSVVSFRLRAAMGPRNGGAAALAQAFEDRVLLDDTSRTLARTHQKLLSLYPAVDEATVEDVRLAAAEAAALALDDEPDRSFGSFTARVADVADRLAELADGT